MRATPQQPVAAISAEGASATISLDAAKDGDVTLIQIDGVGSFSVMVEGRLSPLAPWEPLLDEAMSSNGIKAIATVPQIRLVGQSGSTGLVKMFRT